MGLVHAEGTVLLHDLAEGFFENVPEPVFSERRVMVAGIHIPVCLHGSAVAAKRIVDTNLPAFPAYSRQ